MAEEEENECCPLCMEELDLTDKTFNACPCGYQVCLWCWHQIKNEYNGLCPACRAPYSELSKQKSPLDREDVLRRTKQRRAKEKSERRTASQSRIPTLNRRNLANVRVMQRNLVYVIGLPQHFAEEEILRSDDCFGQYGKIVKAVVNKSHLHSDRANATASAYITYANKDDALACIIAIDGYYLDNSLLRASFGTTKYCNFFLRSMQCGNPDCLYLHELGDQEDSFTKEEMQTALHTSKAAFRDLSHTGEVRAGATFPPAPSALVRDGGSRRREQASPPPRRSSPSSSGDATVATAAESSVAAPADAQRKVQSAAAVSKLRQTNGSTTPTYKRADSYSRIVSGAAAAAAGGGAASAFSATASSPSASSGAEDDDVEDDVVKFDDRKPNLRVDTSMSGASADGLVGPLEALKLATGSSSQEPAWAQPFPNPSLVPSESEDVGHPPAAMDAAVFSPFGMGFDGGIRSSPTSWSGAADTVSHHSSPFEAPLELSGSVGDAGLGGASALSFASIDAIFSQRNESSEALAGLLGVQLASAPMVHGAPAPSATPKSARSSRFAFANPPSLGGGEDLPRAAYRGGLEEDKPSGMFDYAGGSHSSSSASVDAAFPPLRSSFQARPTLSPFGLASDVPRGGQFGAMPHEAVDSASSGLAFLQQMLPNVNISFGEYPGAGPRAPSDAWSSGGGGGSGALGFAAGSSSVAASAAAPAAAAAAPGPPGFFDPAIVSASGSSGFYGFGNAGASDEDRHFQSRFGGFRQSSSVVDN